MLNRFPGRTKGKAGFTIEGAAQDAQRRPEEIARPSSLSLRQGVVITGASYLVDVR